MLFANPLLSAAKYWFHAEQARFTPQVGCDAVEAEDIADARTKLQLEMEAVKVVMSSLRTRYNSLAPVNRLPPEVLSHIFHLFPKDYNDLQHRRCGGYTLEWIKITHVCRQWRSVALGNPALWSNIACVLGVRWTKEFLHRSQMVPIAIDYAFPVLGQSALTEVMPNVIAPHLFRVEELRIQGDREDFQHLIPSLLGSAPVLERMAVRCFGNGPTPIKLPSNFLNGFAPRLRHLKLTECHFAWPWMSLAFNQLVHLEVTLDGYTDVSSGIARFRRMLRTLSKMPRLEVLKLKDVIPRTPSSAESPLSTCCPIVTLDNLQICSLTDDIHNCGMFLTHVIVPVTTRHALKLRCRDGRSGYNYLLPWFSGKVSVVPCVRSLAVTQRHNRGRITAWDHDIIVNGISWDQEIIVNGKWRGREDEESLFDIDLGIPPITATQDALREFCKLVPLAGLQSLHVFIFLGLSLWDWPAIFAECNCLRHIDIAFLTVRSLKGALEIYPSSKARSRPPFPSLESLTLWNIDFDEETDTNLKITARWLEQWGPLNNLKITLKKCKIRQALVDRLRDLGFDVDSDTVEA